MIAPALATLLFSSVLPAAVFIGLVVAATGFLGYCEMYRSLRDINAKVIQIESGDFDVDFGVDRIDEIGETYTGLEDTAQSLGETLVEAEEAQETAETARKEAEEAREAAENGSSELSALTGHLELKAGEYRDTLAAAADGDLTTRVDPESMNEAMGEVGEGINETLSALERIIEESQRVAATITTESQQVADDGERVRSETETVTDQIGEIASETDQQRDQLDDVTDEMSDLSATVEEMASSLAEIAERSDEAAEPGREAQDGSSQPQASLEAIRDQSKLPLPTPSA